MVLAWFRKSRPAARPAPARRPHPPRTPAGARIYAIGDIHGRLDLLDDLLEKIMADAAGAGSPEIIFLGDYIDRGPQSSGVLDRLAHWPLAIPRRLLRGNHEQVMIDAFDNEEIFGQWRRFGGLETLASYGVPTQDVMRGKGFAAARDALGAAVPGSHRSLLAATFHAVEAGDYFFCHAGCRPGIPLETQSPEDLMWIREEFLEAQEPFERFIVHGHTPVAEPELRPGRINIDTGAYASGILTCLVLDGANQRFLQARR